MKKLIINIILFFVASLLLLTLGSIGLLFTLVSSVLNFKNKSFTGYWGNLLYQINIGIDQIGNVMLGEFLNRFTVDNSQDTYKFGMVNETISYVIAKNRGKLNKFGIFIHDVIEWIDEGHFDTALKREGSNR